MKSIETTHRTTGPAPKRQRLGPAPPPPSSETASDDELEHRVDDRTVVASSLSSTEMTYSIPPPTAAYKMLVKTCETDERVLPFVTYWLHNTRFVTLDMTIPQHVLAIYMAVKDKDAGTDSSSRMRPFEALAGRFNKTKGTGKVRGRDIKELYVAMRNAIYPHLKNKKPTVADNVKHYVTEILVTEPFYHDIIEVKHGRKLAVKISNLCVDTALEIIAKRPADVSTNDYTVVRYAIQKVCTANGYELADAPPKAGKRDKWMQEDA